MKIVPTPGRIVYAFSNVAWKGRRVGTIVDVDEESGLCTVKVEPVPEKDSHRLDPIYLSGVHIYAPDERPENTDAWCEWMHYQMGQAAKNDQEVAGLRTQVEQHNHDLGNLHTRLAHVEAGLATLVNRMNTPQVPPTPATLPAQAADQSVLPMADTATEFTTD